MIISQRFTRFLFACLFVLLIPISANAGLIRINFDITDSISPAFGLGYMQFEDDIEFGVSTPINSLTNLDWSIGAVRMQGSISSAVFDTENDGYWSGDLIIDIVAPSVYTASFSSSTFYRFMGNSTFPIGIIALFNNDNFLADTFDGMMSGRYQTSVWFDDPMQTPVPSSILLLIFGLLSLAGLKRRVE